MKFILPGLGGSSRRLLPRLGARPMQAVRLATLEPFGGRVPLSLTHSGSDKVGAVRSGSINTPGILMNLHLSLAPLISLIAGVLILVMPKLLNFIIAIYLIVIGLVGLFGSGRLNL